MATLISGNDIKTQKINMDSTSHQIGTFTFNILNGYYYPINKLEVSWFNQTTSTWIVPGGVTQIFVKMWGAGGGGGAYGGWRMGSQGGGGGYTYALFNVIPGETITIRAGGRGRGRSGAETSFPDGGGSSTGGGDNQYAAKGGGSSSIKIPSISSSYCLFAGGGGGGGCANGYAKNNGGAGGGICGQMASITNYSDSSNKGKGGTQTSGGAAGTGSDTAGGAGSFNQGGTHQNSNCYGGGGGGGYYGGGSGAFNNSNSMGGGGGGSGYVHPSAIFGMTVQGQGPMPGGAEDTALSKATNGTDYIALGASEDGYGGVGLVTIYY